MPSPQSKEVLLKMSCKISRPEKESKRSFFNFEDDGQSAEFFLSILPKNFFIQAQGYSKKLLV